MVFYLDKNPTVATLKMMVADLYKGADGIPEPTKRRAQAVRDQYGAAHERLIEQDSDGLVLSALVNFLDTLIKKNQGDAQKAQGLKVFLLDTMDRGNISTETNFKIQMFISSFSAENLIKINDLMQLNNLQNKSISK